MVAKILDDHKHDGYVFDSLSRMTPETVNDEARVKQILDWDASVRNQRGVWSWFIHHNRKANAQNKKPRSLDDLLGATVIAANTSAAYTLWSNDPQNKVLDVICVKQRMAEMEKAYVITGDPDLGYSERSVLNSEAFEVPSGPGGSSTTLPSTENLANKPGQPGGHYNLGF